MKSLSRVQLLATPWTAAHQASSSMGFSRQEYWSGVPLIKSLLTFNLATRQCRFPAWNLRNFSAGKNRETFQGKGQRWYRFGNKIEAWRGDFRARIWPLEVMGPALDLAAGLGEGNGTPLQYSYLENPMDGGPWWATVHGVAKSRTQLRDFIFPFHFQVLEKEMATHSSVLTWRIPGTGGPGGLPSMGSHRVRHDWRLSSSSSRPWEHISKFNKLMWSLTSVSFYNINASAYLSRSTAVPQLWNSGDIDWGVGWDLQEICSIGHVPALGIHNRAGVRTHLCIDCSVWHISTTRSYNNHTSGLSLSFSFHTSLLIQKKDSTNLKSHFCIRTFLSVFQIYQLC